MMQYSALEKQQAKQAKKAYKQNKHFEDRERRIEQEVFQKRKAEFEQRKSLMILAGILESERLMDDNEPVYGDFKYVIDHEGGKIIRSNIYHGTVRDLKRDLYQSGYQFTNVYTCDMEKRGLLF